ncbi:MAG: pilus assembly protein TadG-related protein [Gemmatimonadota bacterium]|nr:pilus assembly protein TadG-related protein [Gemmatimonadota bacterium]
MISLGLRFKIRDEKGAAIALVALSMVALISAIALAVDVGMLVSARTEAQRVADLSALAGAGILAVDPSADDAARAEAIRFAAMNTVRGQPAVVLPTDVVVDLDSSWVTVDVRRIQARGTPVGTFFARVFGVNAVNISATATAEASPVGPGSGTQCLLPIMLPDRWSENGVEPYIYPGVSDSFDPVIADPKPGDLDDDGLWDTYVAPDSGVTNATGYDESVIGDLIEIHKAGGGGGGMNPSWYFPWTPLDDEDQLIDGGAGAARYLDRFTNCMAAEYLPGDSVLTEPGAMVGPTNTGFDDVYALDPEMVWNTTEQCPYRPSTSSCDYTTPRIKPVPMFDPNDQPDNGRKIVHLRNFGSVFIEAPQPGNDFTARWLGLLSQGDNSEEVEEGLKKELRLIK